MSIINNNLLCYAKQIREFEKLILAKLDLSEYELMERAGAAAFAYLIKFYPHVKKILVCCGGGNNAGDGYVLACLAHQANIQVIINQYSPLEKLPPAAYQAALTAISLGITCHSMPKSINKKVDLIIDALIGIGLKAEVQNTLSQVIHQINESNLPIISIDIPSGLNADTGRVMGSAIKAKLTITFIAEKLGLTTLEGPDYCGQLICEQLGLKPYFEFLSTTATSLTSLEPPFLLGPRLKNSHKNQFGHVLVIGGNYGMPGSVVLTAAAALRVGAGLVSIATRPEHAAHALSTLPETMIYGCVDSKALIPLLKKVSFCVIGPGLGEDEWAKALLQQVLDSKLPVLVDASALRLLSQQKKHTRQNWILTPHPGEAASLLNWSPEEIQTDRLKTAACLHKQYGGNIVLKGAGTIIKTDNEANFVCRLGNPGMASAGTGDVLSGVIAGLAVQGVPLSKATILGVWLHAKAGDAVAQIHGERGLLASDIILHLSHILNGVGKL